MRIRKLKIEDSIKMLEWMHNTDINQYFKSDFSSATKDTVMDFITYAMAERKNERHLAVTDNNDCYMGTVSLKNIDSKNKNAEYAISLCPEAIGKGYANFATKKILDIGFAEYSLIKIYLNVINRNVRAIKFYEKFGFIKEGEFKEHLIIRGQQYNLLWYRMLLSEYLSRD